MIGTKIFTIKAVMAEKFEYKNDNSILWLMILGYHIFILKRVANFRFNYYCHFTINFQNFGAHLAANFLNFPTCDLRTATVAWGMTRIMTDLVWRSLCKTAAAEATQSPRVKQVINYYISYDWV